MTFHDGESCRRRLLRSEAFRRFTTSPAGDRCQPSGGRVCVTRRILQDVTVMKSARVSKVLSRSVGVCHWSSRSGVSVHIDAALGAHCDDLQQRDCNRAAATAYAAACAKAESRQDAAAQLIRCFASRREWSVPPRCPSSSPANGP